MTKKGRKVYRLPSDPLSRKWFYKALKESKYKSILSKQWNNPPETGGNTVKIDSITLIGLDDYTRKEV